MTAAVSHLVYEQESFAIRGAVSAVYREMGAGFLEAVYQECMEHELGSRRIPFRAREPIALQYKGQPLSHPYLPDLVCYDRIIIEIKAVKALTDEHRAQPLNYLRATGLHLGLLVNLCSYPKASVERIAE
ncbi:MAG: GxxExxY protein [Chloroflexi bacterium]|nr:GxxExxY protein [Chloroflexota bacterium]